MEPCLFELLRCKITLSPLSREVTMQTVQYRNITSFSLIISRFTNQVSSVFFQGLPRSQRLLGSCCSDCFGIFHNPELHARFQLPRIHVCNCSDTQHSWIGSKVTGTFSAIYFSTHHHRKCVVWTKDTALTILYRIFRKLYVTEQLQWSNYERKTQWDVKLLRRNNRILSQYHECQSLIYSRVSYLISSASEILRLRLFTLVIMHVDVDLIFFPESCRKLYFGNAQREREREKGMKEDKEAQFI
jgi:hypothetical protein